MVSIPQFHSGLTLSIPNGSIPQICYNINIGVESGQIVSHLENTASQIAGELKGKPMIANTLVILSSGLPIFDEIQAQNPEKVADKVKFLETTFNFIKNHRW